MNIDNLKIKIFSDGADIDTMKKMYVQKFISGLTTNPTLMRKAGILDYEAFSKEILGFIKNKPLSLEVFSDDFDEMENQALKIASWGSNVYVKIPITNTKGKSSYNLVKKLTSAGVKVNVTAIMSLDQIRYIRNALNPNIPSYLSIFAGRIADTGIDPMIIVKKAINLIKNNKNTEIIWASPRELLNIFQAESIGCHIITVTNDILKKLVFINYDLEKYSLDTVKMFYSDAITAGYKI